MPSLGLRLFSSAWFRDFAWNLTYSGYVLCSQQMTVITPDEFEDYSLELLVEPVRGAISSTGQQNTAAPTSTEDYRKPSLRPVPRVHSSPHPDADVLALDRHHNGGERGDRAGRNHKISTSTQRQVSSISKSKLFSIQINLLVNISKCKSFYKMNSNINPTLCSQTCSRGRKCNTCSGSTSP